MKKMTTRITPSRRELYHQTIDEVCGTDFTEPNNVGWRLLGIQSDCVTFERPRRDIQVDAAVFRHLLDIDEMISLILNISIPPPVETCH